MEFVFHPLNIEPVPTIETSLANEHTGLQPKGWGHLAYMMMGVGMEWKMDLVPKTVSTLINRE